MAALKKVTIQAGSPIFFEGDIESHFYIIESGTVSIYTKNIKGERIELAHLKKGEIFGEMALISKDEREASALALTDCVLVQVDEQSYAEMCKELPLWSAALIKNLVGRLKNMNQKLRNKSLT